MTDSSVNRMVASLATTSAPTRRAAGKRSSGSERGEFAPCGFGSGLLLGPCREHVVLVRPDRAVLVAIAVLVAVSQRHALGRQERAKEWRDRKHLVTDQ